MELIDKNFRVAHLGDVAVVATEIGGRPAVGSYGAGVDSFWGLLQMLFNPDPYWVNLRRRTAMWIHSDLGSELPETTWHMQNVAIPLMQEHGMDLTIIKPRKQCSLDGVVYENIYDYYYNQKAFPTQFMTSCSPTFKIDPCRGATELILGHADYDTLIFYEVNESSRVNKTRAYFMNKWKSEAGKAKAEAILERLHYPPVLQGVTRAQMIEDIIEMGYPVPIKSRCFWCIHSKPHDILYIDTHHPALMEKWIALEESGMAYRTPLRAAKGSGPLMLLDPTGRKTVRQKRDELRAAQAYKVETLPFDLDMSEGTGCC